MKKLLLFIALVFWFSSCSTIKRTTEKTTEHTISSDTTRTRHETKVITITEVQKDTIFTVLPDSSIMQALIECDKQGRATIKELNSIRGRRINQGITIKNNLITVLSSVDSMLIYHKYKEIHYSEKQQISEQTGIKTTEVTKETEKEKIIKTRLPSWLFIVLIVAGVFLILKFLVPLLK